jgi:transposase
MSNQYYWHSRISEEKFCRIVRCFADDLTVTETSRKVGLTRKSVNNIFLKIRRCICKNYRPIRHLHFPKTKYGKNKFAVASELSLSGLEKTGVPVVFCAVFDDNLSVQVDIIYASDPKVFTALENELLKSKAPIIQDFGFSDAHLNGIQGLYFAAPTLRVEEHKRSVNRFREFAAQRLKKFKGIRMNMLIYHLKESEWKFNNQNNDLYSLLLEMLRKSQI